jgi:hypothetical protein
MAAYSAPDSLLSKRIAGLKPGLGDFVPKTA